MSRYGVSSGWTRCSGRPRLGCAGREAAHSEEDTLPTHPALTGWSDSSARAVLQLMTESVAEMIGFEVVVLSIVLDDDLVTMAYTGPDEFREHLFETDPVSVLEPVLAASESWGRFRFLHGDNHDSDELEGHWVVFDLEPEDHPDAWHPHNVLLAVLADDEGAMVGLLSVDRPVTGRMPGAAQRSLLERYAAQAERAVLTAFEREELVQQVAHAEAARRMIRSASMPAQASLDAVLTHTHRPLVEGFAASGSWIHVLEPGTPGRGAARSHGGQAVRLSDQAVDLAHQVAPYLWREQQVLVIGDGVDPDLPPVPGAERMLDIARHELKDLGLGSVLAVPLGGGSECLGFLVLTRRAEDPPWSQVEMDSALEIGHDLGAALMTARALERERNLVRELQQLDDYRSHLIATLSHELRTPLTVISGNLEMLTDLDLGAEAVPYQQAMNRGTTRMQKVVDDLLLLARVSDPLHPMAPVPVDLREVTSEVVALVGSTARTKGLTLDVEFDDADLRVAGDAAELDRLLGNLVSNAVKYTPADGTVTVSVTRHGTEVELRVADDGLGISEEDQIGLFRAFYRTTNPDALREPGTGLGLAIVASIVERHQGLVVVRSELGAGTTFTVTLPSAAVSG